MATDKQKAEAANYLWLKQVEELGEAVGSCMKYLSGTTTKTPEEVAELLKKASEELGDVSVFISYLMTYGLIDTKAFWDKYDVRSKKINDKFAAVLTAHESVGSAEKKS